MDSEFLNFSISYTMVNIKFQTNKTNLWNLCEILPLYLSLDF